MYVCFYHSYVFMWKPYFFCSVKVDCFDIQWILYTLHYLHIIGRTRYIPFIPLTAALWFIFSSYSIVSFVILFIILEHFKFERAKFQETQIQLAYELWINTQHTHKQSIGVQSYNLYMYVCGVFYWILLNVTLIQIVCVCVVDMLVSNTTLKLSKEERTCCERKETLYQIRERLLLFRFASLSVVYLVASLDIGLSHKLTARHRDRMRERWEEKINQPTTNNIYSLLSIGRCAQFSLNTFYNEPLPLMNLVCLTSSSIVCIYLYFILYFLWIESWVYSKC